MLKNSRFLKAHWYLLREHLAKKEWLSDIKFQASAPERKKGFLKQGHGLSSVVGRIMTSKAVHVLESVNTLGYMAKEN